MSIYGQTIARLHLLAIDGEGERGGMVGSFQNKIINKTHSWRRVPHLPNKKNIINCKKRGMGGRGKQSRKSYLVFVTKSHKGIKGKARVASHALLAT